MRRPVARSLLAIGLVGLVSACSCDEATETMLITRRGGAFYRCTTAQGDSAPPVCAAKPGQDGNERLEGPGLGSLILFVPDGRTAVLDVRVRCGEVVSVVGPAF